MENFKQIYERMNIRQLCTFLLYGTDDLETDFRSYEQLIKEADAPMNKRINNLYPDGEERDNFYSDITEAMDAREQIYLEIGIKAGARLMFQLLSDRDSV